MNVLTQKFVFTVLFGHNLDPLNPIETLKIIFLTELQKVPPDSLSSYHFVIYVHAVEFKAKSQKIFTSSKIEIKVL